ncbi:MAG: hypothetical protein KAQ67_13000 [Gammaproteobacteria bacterium]|nr:hypothetical protein [Gammaproteobacteria bacterium]
MYSLKQRMEHHGFVSHKDYEYALRCMNNSAAGHIKTLNIEGEPGRRKTAFANALAHALEYKHIHYYEFGLENKSPILIQFDNEEQTIDTQPMEDFEKIIIESCALSEAETTVLILDQLHLASFKDHMSLNNFITSKTWNSSDNQYIANPANLIIMLISETEIYHALQQCSFKIWVDSLYQPGRSPSHQELELEPAAQQWIESLSEIFTALNLNPTLNTYQKIAFDIEHHVRSADQLRISLYGWVEGISYPALFTEEMDKLFIHAQTAIENYIGIEEPIELSGELPGDLTDTE